MKTRNALIFVVVASVFLGIVLGSFIFSMFSYYNVKLDGEYSVYRSSASSTSGIIPVGTISFDPNMNNLRITYLDKTFTDYSYNILDRKFLHFNDSIYKIGYFQGYISIIPQFGEGEEYIYLKRIEE